jgi:hypothetical protein
VPRSDENLGFPIPVLIFFFEMPHLAALGAYISAYIRVLAPKVDTVSTLHSHMILAAKIFLYQFENGKWNSLKKIEPQRYVTEHMTWDVIW